MSHKARNKKRNAASILDRREEARLKAVIDSIGPPREPLVKFYRLPGDGRHVLVGAMLLCEFPIQTTMRYLHFVEGHAQKKFAEAEKAELLKLAGSGEKVATQ